MKLKLKVTKIKDPPLIYKDPIEGEQIEIIPSKNVNGHCLAIGSYGVVEKIYLDGTFDVRGTDPDNGHSCFQCLAREDFKLMDDEV